MVDEPLAETRAACVGVFEARGTHTWPPMVTPRVHWGPIYQRASEGLEDLGLATSAAGAAERAQVFVDRIEEC